MRPSRPRTRDVDLAGIAAIIDAAGTTDAPIDDPIGSDAAGSRSAHMDLGMLLDGQIARPYTPGTADIAFNLPGGALDLYIPRTAHRQIQMTRGADQLLHAGSRINPVISVRRQRMQKAVTTPTAPARSPCPSLPPIPVVWAAPYAVRTPAATAGRSRRGK